MGRSIAKAVAGGSTTSAKGGFSPVDMLKQSGNFPENTTQKPSSGGLSGSFTGSGAKGLPKALAGGLIGLGAAGGSGIPNAIGMITKGRGKATFSGDSFSGMDKKEKKDSKEDQFRTFRVSKDLDYEATKKRLLELAKEEAIKINKAKEADKLVYDRSLPTTGEK
tara:strand:- start:259 stop:753 length:495 start_codon:yes stop_codon:yes gene_type:complete